MSTQKSRSFNSIRNIAFGFGSQLATMILAFATRTIFVRLLGIEYTGVSGLFSNILMLLSLAELGVGNVLIFSLYAPLKSGDEAKVLQYIKFFKIVYYGIAAAVTLLGLVLVPLLPYIIKDTSLPMSELRIYYLLYLFNSVATYFAVDKVTLLQADQKVFIKNVVQAVSSILMHGVMIAYLLVWRNFLGYLIIQVSFTILQNIFLNCLAYKLYPFLRHKATPPDKDFKSSTVKSVKAMFLYKASGVLINYTTNIMISIILGIVAVGAYSNYYLLISYVMTFIGFITTGISASLGNFNANQDPKKSYVMFKNLLFLFSVITAFCVCCYLAIVQGFIRVWVGDIYLLDYGVVIALMVAFYINYIITPVWMYRESMGMFVQIKYVLVVAAILNIALSFLLGKLFGLAGIVIAPGLSRLFTVFWYEPKILFREKFGVPIRCYFGMQLKQLLLNLLIISACLLACFFLPNSLLWLMLKIVICTVIVALFEVLFMRKTDEFKWLISKVSPLLKKIIRR